MTDLIGGKWLSFRDIVLPGYSTMGSSLVDMLPYQYRYGRDSEGVRERGKWLGVGAVARDW